MPDYILIPGWIAVIIVAVVGWPRASKKTRGIVLILLSIAFFAFAWGDRHAPVEAMRIHGAVGVAKPQFVEFALALILAVGGFSYLREK